MNKKYLNLPYFLQFLMVNGYGFNIRKNRYTAEFYKRLANFCELSQQEEPVLNIKQIIDTAKNSSFYRIKNKEDFFNSPIVNKEIVKENYDTIIAPDCVKQYYNTSGTTGSGLKYPVCKEFLFSQWAIFWKFRYLYDLTTKTWCAYIIGKSILNSERKKPPFWIKSYLTKQYLFSSCHLNKDTVKLYLQQIKKSKIKWMHGFPSTLNDLADLIEQTHQREFAKELNLSIITTSSETLFEFQKKNIERVFGCKVKQFYSMTEGVASIYECEEGSLHVDESFSYVEFLKVENTTDQYRVVGSTYFNRAFPLIRYDTGDVVKITDPHAKCKCGRKSRIVNEILGREQDFLILKDGTKVGGSGFFFKKAPNVKRAQIVQKQKGEATFFIVKGPKYSRDEEQVIIDEITNRLGHNFKFRILYTDKLKRLSNGKMKFVINEIDPFLNENGKSIFVEEEKFEDNSNDIISMLKSKPNVVVMLLLSKFLVLFEIMERFISLIQK